MSHATVLVITEEYPTDKILDRLMDPYDENLQVEVIEEDGETFWYNPNAKWDWWCIGGRFKEEDVAIIKAKDYFHVVEDSEDNLAAKYPEEYTDWQKTITGLTNSFYKLEYLQELFPTFYDYLLACKEDSTYAVLTKEGWMEQGRLGWFGMSSASPEDTLTWNRNFYDRFIKDLPKGAYLTYIDYHI